MDLLKTPTNQVLRKMSLPISLGMLSTILFQVVDTYFVGTLGTNPLTALGFASTIYFLLAGLYIGLSVGVSIILGKAMGEGNHDTLKRGATISIIVSLVVASFFSTIGILTVELLFTFLGASENLLAPISSYMIPMYVGMPILAVGIVGGSILRASGKVKLPEVVFGIAGVINLFLDYAFIFGKFGFPALGIAGVAYGTVLSWIFIFIVIIFTLIKDGYFINILSNKNLNTPILTSIYKLGLPSVVSQLVSPFTILFITYLLGKQEPTAVAAYGVAGRIETLLMITIMGISTATTPFIAQNLGAKLVKRIDEAIVFGGKASFYLGTILIAILFIFIEPIARIFSDQQVIIDYTSSYFYIVSLSYIFYMLYLITGAIFSGLELPNYSLKIMLVKTLLFTIPLTIAGSFFGVQGIFIGLAISNVMGGLYAAYEMRKELKKVGSELAQRNPFKDMMNDFKLSK